MTDLFLDGKTIKLKDELPLVALKDSVIFPNSMAAITVGRTKSKLAIDEARNGDGMVVFVCQKNPRLENPKNDELYSVGTISRIRGFWAVNGDYNLRVEGLSRIYIRDFLQKDPFFQVRIEEIPELTQKSDEVEALVRNITAQMRHFGEVGGSVSLESSIAIFSAEDPNRLVDAIAAGIDFETVSKQEILETVDIIERLKKVSELLAHEIRILEIGQQIATDTQRRVGKVAEETILREQMKSIEKRLGEDEEESDIKELEKKIKNAHMPKEVLEKAEKELKRLAKMSPANPETSYIRNFLDWLTDLCWTKTKNVNVDIKKAQKILDEDHYGLKKVKERIVEYMAVLKLAKKVKGPILCFAGPPGTGKTSIGKSIAKALGRKFVKVSLGGIRDEAEIRGHRRTYVGAMPGRIIQGLKNAGSCDPVFMLDEIDKVGTDFRGDPSAALLEALDPEQNNAFSDHYLEVPYDLSDVIFITTANVLDTIPPALLDRLEIIEFPSYTEEEKFNIARNFLVSKEIEAHGLKKDQVILPDKLIKTSINSYTREAGGRNLEREIASVCRKIAKKIAEGKIKKSNLKITDLHAFLGPARYSSLLAEKKDEVGMSTGLAVTQAGGVVLFVEVALMPGKGNLLLTGQLGDIMKESCQAAMSYVRSRASQLNLPENFFHKIDVHVHVPEGATPKDGPSAGVTIATAMVSALTKTATKRDVGMTGEITLRGRVLEIGGVKEKVLAAHRAGLKTIILPKDNKKDLEDIPKNIRQELKFVFAKHLDDVLEIALAHAVKTSRKNVTSKKEKISFSVPAFA